MKRINNTDDLTGHSKECFVKKNLDGTVCVLCVCKEDKPTKKFKKVKKVAKKIEAPVIEEVSVDTHEFNLDFDPKH